MSTGKKSAIVDSAYPWREEIAKAALYDPLAANFVNILRQYGMGWEEAMARLALALIEQKQLMIAELYKQKILEPTPDRRLLTDEIIEQLKEKSK